MSATLIEPTPIKLEQPALPKGEPCVIVIFGATGDLTKRKLMPALCRLLGLGCLDSVRIIGVGRTEMTDDGFQTLVREALDSSKKIEHLDQEQWREFSGRLRYLSGELDKDETYRNIAACLDQLAAEGASQNHLFYFATPPSLFSVIVERLGKAGLAQEGEHWSRIVVEKPFGRDLESAKELNASITTSAKTQSKTFSSFASATRCLNRSGTATMSTMSRLQRRRPEVLAVARDTTKRREHSAIW